MPCDIGLVNMAKAARHILLQTKHVNMAKAVTYDI
jgi:hypothetical protein